MANAVKGEVPLKLSDGRAFTMVLDFGALIEAESAYGKPLRQLMADVVIGFAGATRALIFGALRPRHPEVTMAEVTAMMASDIEAFETAVESVIRAAFPEPDITAKPAEDRKGENPRGKRSGRSGAKPG